MCLPILVSEKAYCDESLNFYWEQLPQKTKIVLEAKAPISYEVVSDAKSLDYVLHIKDLDLSNLPKELVIDTAQVKAIRFYKEGDSYYLKIQRISLFPCEIKTEGGKLQVLIEGVNAEKQETPVPEVKPEAAPSKAEPVVEKKQVEIKKVAEETKTASVPAKKATKLQKVAFASEGGANKVTFYADGKIAYKSFILHNPERIVIDLYDLNVTMKEKQTTGNTDLVDKIRVGLFQVSPTKIVRAVVDIKKAANYNVSELDTALILNIPAISNPSAESHAPEEAKTIASNEAAPSAPAVAPVVEEKIKADTSSAAETKPGVVTEKSVSDEAIQERETTLRSDKALFSNEEEEKAKKEKATAVLRAQTIVSEEKKWEGEAFTFDFRDIDIKDLFRFIADISGLNIILDPAVTGKITLKLSDVPWDQALDLICRSQGLGYALEGNVIRIAPLNVLSKEAEDRRKQKEQEELLRPMQTIIRPLSYANASEVSQLVKKLLSPKGTIDIDQRTNTLIITDIDKKIPAIENLLNSLDLRISQVIIEARLVETSREFSQGLGIQWGFRGLVDQAYGNSTSLSFPNSIGLWGNKLQSTLGGLSGNPLGGYAVNLPTNQAPTAAVMLSTGNILDTFRLDVALEALENAGHGRILSNPKIATQNNKQAEIRQGYQIPVQTIANNTVTTSFVNATLSLMVTPQITAEETIIMDVTVENNRPDFGNVVFGTPPIITQRAKTMLLMENGATAVMGGILVRNIRVEYSPACSIGAFCINRRHSQQYSRCIIFFNFITVNTEPHQTNY